MLRFRRALRPAAVVALLLAGVVACTGDGDDVEEPASSSSTRATDDAVDIGAVRDGDSFVARAPDGREIDVRMIGVNAPEVGECHHAEARVALRELLRVGPVRLERDVTDLDRYGRLLRHVRTADGRLAGEVLVARGLALAVPSPPDEAHTAALRAAQDMARAGPAGLWDPAACGPPAATGVRIEAVVADPPGHDQDDLNGEQVVIVNEGAAPVVMTGWKLRDHTGNRFQFPAGFTLPAGGRVTVHVGPGTDAPTALHWGRRHPVLDNGGDTALLLDASGNVASYRDVGGGGGT